MEEPLGQDASGVLALRMLYSSVYLKSGLTYNSFLTGMDRRLLHSLEPLDVLYFWQQAGEIGAGTTWMAVFAVDEVCMQSTRGVVVALLFAHFCMSSSITMQPGSLFVSHVISL